jgi:hypothetical protein
MLADAQTWGVYKVLTVRVSQSVTSGRRRAETPGSHVRAYILGPIPLVTSLKYRLSARSAPSEPQHVGK